MKTISQRFPTHFRKIFEESPKIIRRPHEKLQTFSDNLRILPKNSEDSRKCFDHNKIKYNSRDKLDISEIISLKLSRRNFYLSHLEGGSERHLQIFFQTSSKIAPNHAYQMLTISKRFSCAVF